MAGSSENGSPSREIASLGAVRAVSRGFAAKFPAGGLDKNLILACAALPANRPEQEAAPHLSEDLGGYPDRKMIGELAIDRGHVGSSLVDDTLANEITSLSEDLTRLVDGMF